MQLEQTASMAHDAGGTSAPPDVQASVQARFAELQLAAQAYLTFLQSIGV